MFNKSTFIDFINYIKNIDWENLSTQEFEKARVHLEKEFKKKFKDNNDIKINNLFYLLDELLHELNELWEKKKWKSVNLFSNLYYQILLFQINHAPNYNEKFLDYSLRALTFLIDFNIIIDFLGSARFFERFSDSKNRILREFFCELRTFLIYDKNYDQRENINEFWRFLGNNFDHFKAIPLVLIQFFLNLYKIEKDHNSLNFEILKMIFPFIIDSIPELNDLEYKEIMKELTEYLIFENNIDDYNEFILNVNRIRSDYFKIFLEIFYEDLENLDVENIDKIENEIFKILTFLTKELKPIESERFCIKLLRNFNTFNISLKLLDQFLEFLYSINKFKLVKCFFSEERHIRHFLDELKNSPNFNLKYFKNFIIKWSKFIILEPEIFEQLILKALETSIRSDGFENAFYAFLRMLADNDENVLWRVNYSLIFKTIQEHIKNNLNNYFFEIISIIHRNLDFTDLLQQIKKLREILQEFNKIFVENLSEGDVDHNTDFIHLLINIITKYIEFLKNDFILNSQDVGIIFSSLILYELLITPSNTDLNNLPSLVLIKKEFFSELFQLFGIIYYHQFKETKRVMIIHFDDLWLKFSTEFFNENRLKYIGIRKSLKNIEIRFNQIISNLIKIFTKEIENFIYPPISCILKKDIKTEIEFIIKKIQENRILLVIPIIFVNIEKILINFFEIFCYIKIFRYRALRKKLNNCQNLGKLKVNKSIRNKFHLILNPEKEILNFIIDKRNRLFHNQIILSDFEIILLIKKFTEVFSILKNIFLRNIILKYLHRKKIMNFTILYLKRFEFTDSCTIHTKRINFQLQLKDSYNDRDCPLILVSLSKKLIKKFLEG
ncbi:MAG: hypothetical protein ACTSQP_23565 [Promethearchaeota archaeon]